MTKDIILGYCKCKEKQMTLKKYAGSLLLVCVNCDHTLSVISRYNEPHAELWNLVSMSTESKLRKLFAKRPYILREALSMKKEQKEVQYKRKLDGNID